jgi:hypothetical protein
MPPQTLLRLQVLNKLNFQKGSPSNPEAPFPWKLRTGQAQQGLHRSPKAPKRSARSLGNRYLCRDLADIADRYRRIGGSKKRDDLLTIAQEHSPDSLSRANVYAHAQQRS